jgi:hypothetical protein
LLYAALSVLHHSNHQSTLILTSLNHINYHNSLNYNTIIMKFTTVTSISAILASSLALPTDVTYGPPPGGWESVDYPAGTGENLPFYPPPPG